MDANISQAPAIVAEMEPYRDLTEAKLRELNAQAQKDNDRGKLLRWSDDLIAGTDAAAPPAVKLAMMTAATEYIQYAQRVIADMVSADAVSVARSWRLLIRKIHSQPFKLRSQHHLNLQSLLPPQ